MNSHLICGICPNIRCEQDFSASRLLNWKIGVVNIESSDAPIELEEKQRRKAEISLK